MPTVRRGIGEELIEPGFSDRGTRTDMRPFGLIEPGRYKWDSRTVGPMMMWEDDGPGRSRGKPPHNDRWCHIGQGPVWGWTAIVEACLWVGCVEDIRGLISSIHAGERLDPEWGRATSSWKERIG